MRSLRGTRPPFLGIIPGKKRDDYQARLLGVEKEAERLRERIQLLDQCEPHVAKMVEHEIELQLREHCPEYIHALAALRQKEDWLRCLDRFDDKIFEFTRAVGNVRNLACSGYARQTNIYSDGAVQAFGIAYRAGEHVEQEVTFANRISDAQLEVLRASGIDTKPLPRLPETSFTEWIATIKTLPLNEAQMQFDRLIEETKAIHEAGVPQLRAQAEKVQETQDGDIHNFLIAAWEHFRTEIAGDIFPGDTERMVAETAKMLSTEAQASVVGRL